MSQEERRVTAYHEAGHALVALGVKGAVPPYKVSILPRGGSLGHCSMLDDHDRVAPSRSDMLAFMATSVGGWVAELLVFSEVSAGSGSDLKRVRRIAQQMVCELGMSEEFGAMTPIDDRGYNGPAPLSDGATAAIRRLVDEATGKARAVLTDQRDMLDRVAAALLERETLTRAQIEAIMHGKSPTSASRLQPGEPA